MGRGIVIALIISVALNVFAIGFLSGRVITDNPEQPILKHDNGRELRGGPRVGNPFRFMRYAEVLPAESRDAFRASIRAEMPAVRDQHRKVRALRRAYADAVSASEWDRVAVEAALTELQRAQDDQRTLMNNIFLDAFEKLEPEERALLVELAGKRDGKRGKRRERWREKPPEE